MNHLVVLQLLQVLQSTPSKIEQVQMDRKIAIECLQRKECKSVWSEATQEWVVVRIEKEEVKDGENK